MLKNYAALFSELMSRITDFETSMRFAESHLGETVDPTPLNRLKSCAALAIELGEEFELDAVLAQARRLENYTTGHLVRDVVEGAADLKSRFQDQLESKLFLFVHPARVKYYRDPQLFGSAVNDRFPKAIDDIEGAGKCLALDQGTACVLHLMRVMEDGLKALAKVLGIPYAPSWESYLEQIQTKISAPRKRKSATWKRNEKFFRDISGELLTVKQAWRNPTMHIDRKYSPDEAEEIFRAVKSLMRHLAEGLPRPKKRKTKASSADADWLSIS